MESAWIRHGPDLIAVAQDQEHGWFNGFLEDTLNKISRKATVVSTAFSLYVEKALYGNSDRPLPHNSPRHDQVTIM